MQKKNLLIVSSLLLTPFLFGCEESVVTALKNVISTTPTVTLGSPSYSPGPTALKASGTATISVTFANAHTVHLVNGSGSSGAAPAGLTVVPSGPTCSTVALSSVTFSGASISVSGCTGNGTLTVKVNAGAIEAENGDSSAETAVATITVDNVTPVTTAFTQTKTKTTASGANVITATFAGRVQDLSSTNANGEFSITGCTGTTPNVAIAMTQDGSGNSIATATLSGGSCGNGNNVDVDLNLDKVTDMAGNDGDPSDNPTTLTFTIDTAVPTATLAVDEPIVGVTSGANIVEATFSELIQAISTTNANGVFTITGCTTAPSVSVAMSVVAGHSVATATLSGGTCANSSTVTVTLNMDKVTDQAGNAGLVAGNQTDTYTIDTANVAVTLGAPDNATLDPVMVTTSTMTLTLAHAKTTTLADANGTTASPPAGVAVNAVGGVACDVALTNVSAGAPTEITDWTIVVNNCTGSGTVDVSIDAAVAESYSGNQNSATAAQQIIVTP